MFVEAVILGLIIGFFCNGSFDNLKNIRIRGIALVVIAGIIQYLPVFIGRFSVVADKIQWFTPISIFLLLLCLLINLDRGGIWLIFIGTAINFIVIVVNKMKMPVLFKSLRISGLEHMIMPIKMGDVINYIPFSEARFISGYFGKIIPIPDAYPLAHVLSIGDVLISIGIIVFVVKSMKRHYFGRSNRIY